MILLAYSLLSNLCALCFFYLLMAEETKGYEIVDAKKGHPKLTKDGESDEYRVFSVVDGRLNISKSVASASELKDEPLSYT